MRELRARMTLTDPLRGVLAMLVSGALLTLNDAAVKQLMTGYPTGQVLFLRGAVFLLPVLLLAHRTGGLATLRVSNWKGQGARAGCVLVSSFLFVSGLKYLPLADAIAVAFANPLFVTLLAPLALGERVGWRRWSAVGLGFLGVLVMIRPTSEAVRLAALFPLCAAFVGAFRDIVTRRLTGTDSTASVLLVTTSAVVLGGLATAPFGWPAVAPGDWWLFVASGLLVGGAHYFMIEAFRLGEAAVVAPFKYFNMIWAVLFGLLFFGDWPDGWTLAGAAVVVSSGLYILHRETARVGRRGAGPG